MHYWHLTSASFLPNTGTGTGTTRMHRPVPGFGFATKVSMVGVCFRMNEAHMTDRRIAAARPEKRGRGARRESETCVCVLPISMSTLGSARQQSRCVRKAKVV